MLSRSIQRDRTEDLGRKRLRVLLESYCLRARQGVVCDNIKEIEGENPQKWDISPEPRKFPFESERCSMLSECRRQIVAVPAQSDLLCLLTSPLSIPLKESETGGK